MALFSVQAKGGTDSRLLPQELWPLNLFFKALKLSLKGSIQKRLLLPGLQERTQVTGDQREKKTFSLDSFGLNI